MLLRIESGAVRPILSVPLVLEYEEVLRRHASVLRLTIANIDAVLNDLCTFGEHHSIFFLWRPTLRDPDDELVLEVAVAAQSPVIVTHNVKDFDGADQFGVRVYTPREWLRSIGERQ